MNPTDLKLRPCSVCRCRIHPALFPANSDICQACLDDARLLNGQPQKPFAPADPLVFPIQRSSKSEFAKFLTNRDAVLRGRDEE
jgi:hypothetical protein